MIQGHAARFPAIATPATSLFPKEYDRRCSLCGAPFSRCCAWCAMRGQAPEAPFDPVLEQAEEADRQRQVALAALRRAVRVGLVSCGKSKRPGTHAARDLYISALFRLAIRVADASCDDVWILSAKHGAIPADRIIESYDQRLPGDQKSLCLWGVNARNTLTCSYPHFTVDLTFYAGAHYVAPILAAGLPQDWRHDEPLEGLGLGARLAWLKTRLTFLKRPSTERFRTPPAAT